MKGEDDPRELVYEIDEWPVVRRMRCNSLTIKAFILRRAIDRSPSFETLSHRVQFLRCTGDHQG